LSNDTNYKIDKATKITKKDLKTFEYKLTADMKDNQINNTNTMMELFAKMTSDLSGTIKTLMAEKPITILQLSGNNNTNSENTGTTLKTTSTISDSKLLGIKKAACL
jgi:hypothetical protein